MDLGLLLLIFAAVCVAGYFAIKWILILLLLPFFADKEAREAADREGARDITIRIEITGLPKPAEEDDQEQPQQPSTSA